MWTYRRTGTWRSCWRNCAVINYMKNCRFNLLPVASSQGRRMRELAVRVCAQARVPDGFPQGNSPGAPAEVPAARTRPRRERTRREGVRNRRSRANGPAAVGESPGRALDWWVPPLFPGTRTTRTRRRGRSGSWPRRPGWPRPRCRTGSRTGGRGTGPRSRRTGECLDNKTMVKCVKIYGDWQGIILNYYTWIIYYLCH